MTLLLSTFQAVSLIFALLAVWTGGHALFRPASFASSFGLPLPLSPSSPASQKERTRTSEVSRRSSKSYVSLMGVRQLATGIILLVAMVGAIVLTHREVRAPRGQQNIGKQIARRPQDATVNARPEVGQGVKL